MTVLKCIGYVFKNKIFNMHFKKHLCKHYLNLNFSEEFLSGDTQISIQDPYPINKPMKGSPSVDKIGKFKDDLATYNKKLLKLRKHFKKIEHRLLNQDLSGSHATIPRGLLNFCNFPKPEKPFDCDYNPFFGTGVLEKISLNGTEHLIRPDGKNNLYLTRLDKPWKRKKLNLIEQFDDITGITSPKTGNPILVKHKIEIKLIKVQNKKEVEIVLNRKFKKSLLDAKINETKICAIPTDGKCRIFDIATNTKLKFNNLGLQSAISCSFLDEDSLGVLEQKKLKFIDLRSKDWKLFDPKLTSCDTFSALKCHKNYIYLATRHYLLLTDIRFLKNQSFCTHLLKNTPSYIDLSDDFLCLSTQENEGVLFYGNPISSLPIRIPNIIDTFDNCKIKKGLFLREDLSDRFSLSNAGIKLVSVNKEVFLYSVNALGDIYQQKISLNTTDRDESLERFYNWTKYIQKPDGLLHLTKTHNLSSIRGALNGDVDAKYLSKWTQQSTKVNRFFHCHSRYRKENFGALAANFASVWYEDDEDVIPENVDLGPAVPVIDKVTNWIEESYFFDK